MRILTPVTSAALTAVLILACVWLIDTLETERFQQSQRAEVMKTLSFTRARLEASIHKRLTLVKGLAAFAKTSIVSGRNITHREFDSFAQELHENTTGIRSIQLQPDAVVRFVYPLAGNEAVIGHDLLADPARRGPVQRAIEDKVFLLIGPVSLLQGGKALIGRFPIYFTEGDTETFWGFATILLDLDPIYREAGLLDDRADVIYALRGKNGEGASGEVFFGPPTVFDNDSLAGQIALPHGSWQLAVLPTGGWQDSSVRQWWLRGFGVMLALLAAAAVFVLHRSPHELKERVRLRTLEHEKALADLSREKAMVNSIIDSMPDLIFCKDMEGRYLRCNSAFEEYIGQSRDRIFNRTDEELIFDEMPAHFHELDMEALQARRTVRAEEWVTFADGRTRLLDTFKVPFKNVEGDVIGMIGVSRDSTQRKWGEQALEASEKKYREMIEGLDDTVFRISLSSQQYDYVSCSSEKVFGYVPDTFLENKDFVHEVIHPDCRASFEDYWDSLLQANVQPRFEYSIIDAHGKRRWLVQSARVVRDDQGAPVAVEGICADVTEAQRNERILRTIAEGVSGVVGEQFFQELTRYLATAFDMEFALLLSLDGDNLKANSVACYRQGEFLEDFSYVLEGTPCERVLKDGTSFLAKGTAAMFPLDQMLGELGIESYIGTRLTNSSGRCVGVLVLMDTHPMKSEESLQTTLEIFAVRAAVELERLEQEKALLKVNRAIEQSPVGAIITDLQGHIEYVNKSYCAITGYDREFLIGKTPSVLKSGKQSQSFYKKLWGAITAGEEWHGELQNRKRNGELYWAKASIYPVFADGGKLSHFVALKEDVTESKQRDARLNIASTVFDTTSEAIFVSDAENRIQLVNPAFTRISGYEAEEVLGKTPSILSSGHHSDKYYQDMMQSLETSNHWEGEIWNRRKNGEVFAEWLSIVRVLNKDGEVERYVAVFSDISKRKEVEGMLYRQANFDTLTELPNRLLAADRLAAAISRARRVNAEVALLHLGLDRFKWVNDTYGHDAGDTLLKLTAERLSQVIRDSDTVARIGGDEFLIILPEIASGQDAEYIASKICQRLSEPYKLEQGEAFTTASAGIVVFPYDAETVPALLHHADSALWRAKQQGGGHYCFFTSEMNDEAQLRAALEVELRQALENREFELFYQPLIDLSSGRVAGAEALIRWQHPEKGLRMPGEFIDLAEKTGLIVPMGRWVLETACAQLKAWEHGILSGLRLSVNMSPKQFADGDEFERVLQQIKHSDVDTRRLVIEITETLLMEGDSALWSLQKLKELGGKLSMDDFGTGYSSLSYLKRFPIDILKIDRSFVQDLPNSNGDAVLVEAIVSMARSLNLQVVAEGVETSEQSDFLEKLGCHYLQGFYYGKPMPIAEFEQFAKEFRIPELEYTGPDFL